MKQFIKIDGIGSEEDVVPVNKDVFISLSAVLCVEDVSVGPYLSLICLHSSAKRFYSKERACYIVSRLERQNS